MSLSAERVKLFAEKCTALGKKLGVDVVDLHSLFHSQPVRQNVLTFSFTDDAKLGLDKAQPHPIILNNNYSQFLFWCCMFYFRAGRHFCVMVFIFPKKETILWESN